MKELNYKTTEQLTVSASKINLFYECPRKYFYRYLYIWEEDKIKQVSWPGSGFGEAIHKVLEWTAFRLLEGIEKKQIFKLLDGKFKEFYDEWLKNNEKTFQASKGYNYKKFISKGEKYAVLITRFFISYFDDFKDILPEKKFEKKYKLSKYDVNINGIIDLVYFFDKGFKIIDFKTTKESNKFYFIDWSIDTQSLMYLYYSLQEYKSTPSSFSYLILNHEDNTLFFKEQAIKAIENEKTFFKGLTSQINTICEYTLKPDMELSNSSQRTCMWCEFKEVCDLKHKVNLKNLFARKKK
jgi:CRISPR/Cas system-associated exonuclease Cas4 (RecB family)